MDAVAQARIDAIIDERTGVLGLARRNREATAVQVQTGRMSAEVKDQVDRIVFAFAEKIAIGLHVAEETPPEVRGALRDPVKALQKPAVLS